MFRNNHDQKYLNRIFKRVLARKTHYYHRNLLVHDQLTNFKIIKISKRQDVLETVGGYTTLPDNVCYLVKNTSTFSTIAFKSNVDIVLLSINWKVLGVRPNVLKDKIVTTPYKTNMILIMPIGSIEYLAIKENDIVRA